MMRSETNKILWIGAFIIIISGTLAHFVFDLSRKNSFLACFVPVNESVWEHFKLGYLGVLLSFLYDYNKVKKLGSHFYFTSKLLGLLSQTLLIVVVYYTCKQFYTGILVWLDILSFMTGAVICQFIVIKMAELKIKKRIPDKLGLVFILAIGILMIYFTFFPPQLPIFKDNNTNTYGIYNLK